MDSTPLILTHFKAPYNYDNFPLAVQVEGQKFKSMSDCWSFLRFLVAMRGLIVNPKEVDSIRLSGNNLRFGKDELHFDVCHLFVNSKVKADLKVTKTFNKGIYRVIDLMRLPFCNVEKLRDTKVKGSHIDEIRYAGKKQIVCVSYLNFDQLNDFDYSDTMSKFFIERHLLSEPDLIRPLISPNRGPRKPKPIVTERIVELWEDVIYEDTDKVICYGQKDRLNIIKAYRRYNSSS